MNVTARPSYPKGRPTHARPAGRELLGYWQPIFVLLTRMSSNQTSVRIGEG